MSKNVEFTEEPLLRSNSKSYTKVPSIDIEGKVLNFSKKPSIDFKNINFKKLSKKIRIAKSEKEPIEENSQNSSIKFVKNFPSQFGGDKNSSIEKKNFTFDNVFNKKINQPRQDIIYSQNILQHQPINLGTVGSSHQPINLGTIGINNLAMTGAPGHISININNYNFNNFDFNQATKFPESVMNKNNNELNKRNSIINTFEKPIRLSNITRPLEGKKFNFSTAEKKTNFDKAIQEKIKIELNEKVQEKEKLTFTSSKQTQELDKIEKEKENIYERDNKNSYSSQITNNAKQKTTMLDFDNQNDSFIDELNNLLLDEDHVNQINNQFDNINFYKVRDLEFNKNKDDSNPLITESGKDNYIDEIKNPSNLYDNNTNTKEESEIPDPRINFAHLQMINSNRPQTSYGGISARKKSLQNNRQMSSKADDRVGSDSSEHQMFGMKNKLSQMKHKI